MKYKYRATRKGTLSNPFKFVKAGELVVSDKEIKASWLAPEEAYEPPKELPITATSTAQQVVARQNPAVPPVAAGSGYETAMQDVRTMEAAQDALQATEPQAVTPPPAAPPAPQEQPAVQPTPQEAPQEVAGTGDQDVI